MSVGELQACLARLYVDEPFRKLFYLDPLRTLEEYRLTADERAAIQGIEQSQLEFFASSLRRKRSKRIQAAYPLLFSLDEAELDRYYARYYQLYTAKPHQSGHQDAIDFGAFMEESLVDAEHLPPYAGEVAKYERLYYSATLAPALDGDGDASRPTRDAHARVTSLDARPSIRPGVAVADFEYDVAEIEEVAQRGDPLAGLDFKRTGCSIIFRPATRTSAAKILRLNAATKTVLGLCDGRRTVSQIVAGVETALDGEGLADSIVDAINRLLALQVLALDLEPGPASAPHRSYGASQVEAM